MAALMWESSENCSKFRKYSLAQLSQAHSQPVYGLENRFARLSADSLLANRTNHSSLRSGQQARGNFGALRNRPRNSRIDCVPPPRSRAWFPVSEVPGRFLDPPLGAKGVYRIFYMPRRSHLRRRQLQIRLQIHCIRHWREKHRKPCNTLREKN
jgi:hypothetical protein